MSGYMPIPQTPPPPVHVHGAPSFTALDEALIRLINRMNRAQFMRTVFLALALLSLFGGAGLAGWQLLRVASVEVGAQSSAAVLGEVLGLNYAYSIILTNGLTGLVGFAFFGWFGLAYQTEAQTLRALIEIERARMER